MRSLSSGERHARRLEVIRLRSDGLAYSQIASRTGLSRTGVFDICKRYETQGPPGLSDKPNGRMTGHGRLLLPEQESLVCALIAEQTPDQLGLAAPLWTPAEVAQMIFERLGIRVQRRAMRLYLLPELLAEMLEQAGVAPGRLELELTESVAADDPDAAISMMNRLRAVGVRMSIDDFGTGYSSLSYLKRFKVYKLKIDQSFVRGITGDADDQVIVSAIISMAKSLGLRTIAEGVETAEQMDYLRQAGCDEMQGYLLSRPLPAARFEAFVESR